MQVVADEDQRLVVRQKVLDLAHALPLEVLVADRQDLVDEEHLVVHVGRDREPEAELHARAVGAHGVVDEALQFGELHHLRDELLDDLFGHAQHRAGEANVLPSRELGVEPEPEVQEARHRAVDVDPPLGGLRDPREEPEQGALPGSVCTDHSERGASPDLEVDVAERPELDVVAPVPEELEDPATVAAVNVEPLADAARMHRQIRRGDGGLVVGSGGVQFGLDRSQLSEIP